MTIAGIDDLTSALKTVLSGIAGLTAYAVEPASPKYPCAWVFFRNPAIDYDNTFDGAYTAHLMITVATQGSAEHQQTNLRPYLAATGTKSIVAAIDADVTLGLPGVSARVLRVDGIGPIQAAGVGVWGATFPLDCMVDPV